MLRSASAFTRPPALLMRTASPGCKPKYLRGSTRPSKQVIMMMRALVRGLARRVENGGAGLYVWANVALRERKLASRGSLGVCSAVIVLGTGVCAGNKSGG